MGIRIGDVFQVKTERLAYGGDAVARHEGLVIFIPYAAPGEVVRVRVTNVKKTYARAVVEEVVVPSAVRREPECRHFGVCGGCQLQHVEYAAQLKAKAEFIRDSLTRLGHIDFQGEIKVRASPEFGYRTRSQVKIQRRQTAGNAGDAGDGRHSLLIGFNKHGSHSICDVESCPILDPQLNSALGDLRRVLDQLLSGESDSARGLPSEVEIASGDASVSFAPHIAGLPGGPVSREVAGIRYQFTPGSFFQSNSFLLDELVRAAVGEENGDLAVDLYCGVGLFTAQLSGRYSEVIGVESDREAAELARTNMRDNNIANTRVVRESAESFARNYASSAREGSARKPDLVLLDPPRTGAGDAVPWLIEIAPPRITYVSCDPTTLARDIAKLTGSGYLVADIEAFDLFPQTYHVETIVKVERGH